MPRLKTQVNRTNKEGDTALIILAFCNPPQAVECAKVLLTEGLADVSAGQQEEAAPGTTYHHPLRQAVRRGNKEMCEVLIEYGHADPRVALEVCDEEASLRDVYDNAPGRVDGEAEATKRARDILEMLSSRAGVRPSRKVRPYDRFSSGIASADSVTST